MRKRIFDIVVSVLVVSIALPLWVLAIAGIKLETRGPVFFRARRIGRGGREFRIFKFRTMVDGASIRGPGLTRAGDPRITRVGRLLRALKVDEMPQLLNVIRGEMSIVGPRPEDPRYIRDYTSEQRRVLLVRPGMASPAFIKYRHEEQLLANAGGDFEAHYRSEVLPDKLKMDLEYIDRQSFFYDLRIIGQAAISLFIRHDATPATPHRKDAL